MLLQMAVVLLFLRFFRDLLAVDLGKLALRGLLNRNPELDPKDIDYLLFGTVIQVHKLAR